MGPFQHTRLSRGHCNDWELEKGQGTMHASVRDPTQAPGRHPHTQGNCKAGECRSSSWDHPASRASHSLPAVTEWLTQPQLAELHEGAQTILQQPFAPSSTSRGDRHVEGRGKAQAPQLAQAPCEKQGVDEVQTGSRHDSGRHCKDISAHAQGFEEFNSIHSSFPKPWPEQCTTWESCMACDLRQAWGEAQTQPPSSKVLGRMHHSPTSSEEKTSYKDTPSKCWWSNTLSDSEGQWDSGGSQALERNSELLLWKLHLPWSWKKVGVREYPYTPYLLNMRKRKI